MSQASGVEPDTGRLRAPGARTRQDVRLMARRLLGERGADAVTLRAIARELGITAPALYRYYASRQDLLRHVGTDICADLTDELTTELIGLPDDRPVQQLFAVCRGFRRWARAHPREFSLVFASPAPEPQPGDGAPPPRTIDPFGRVFLTVAGRVLTVSQARLTSNRPVPREMHDELLAFRQVFRENLARQGIELPAELPSLGSMHFMLEFWARLYGHVALEVFGRFPYQISNTEPLFEQMLADLAAEAGLTAPRGTDAD